MKSRVRAAWEEIRSSYWFVPGLMALFTTVLSFASIAVDQRVQYDWVQEVGFIWSGGAEGARGLLSTVTGSVITVAGVVFSVTLTALSLASQQFGPRLLRNFMRDTGNQVVLGTFVATFIYGILVLRTIRGGDSEFVPYISVTIALMLTIASLAVLIYFFHHASLSIQAPYVIAGVAAELDGAIAQLFPEGVGSGAADQAANAEGEAARQRLEENAHEVTAPGSGYLQAVDEDALMACATDNDVILLVMHRPGHFVIQDMPLVKLQMRPGLGDEVVGGIREAFAIGRQRSSLQDVEYAIEQLVEVAVRSLSPGINDPFTAMNCIDWLAAELSRLAKKNFPSPYRYDDAGRLRVIVDRPVTFAGLVETAFDQIRQYANSSVAVRMRLLEAISVIGEHVSSEENRSALRRQAIMIQRESEGQVAEPGDRQEIANRFQKAIEAVERT